MSHATAAPSQATARIILVTGPSGAGRTTAVRVLEDLGCEAIDNLPLSLVPRLLDGPALGRDLVLGVDVRNRDFSVAAFQDLIEQLRGGGARVEVLYLDAEPAVLERRYSETRRRHPLAPAETPAQGILREQELLLPIRALADILIDTSAQTPHDLKAELGRLFEPDGAQRMALVLHSFSYKRGMPRGIDMVFDCRFLKNPYWDVSLRALDGRDPRVAAFIGTDDRYAPFFDKVNDLSEFLLPAYTAEGKSHLSIGFGCTGGQHRSVALAEALARRLGDNGWKVSLRHHELERRSALMAAQVAEAPR
ncbi:MULTISPECIES: RNase adapter RapZ [unclassified Meridianimarinicoccus]|uniref:RNase adapter RapZ n=1 Tax=unclassified Meridianimarinicoccus TaxID=2923344 RepID=UPI001868DE9C|nr:RNase adapter RapZ [Fluviibacterium sp. MJW13]